MEGYKQIISLFISIVKKNIALSFCYINLLDESDRELRASFP